MTLCTYLPPIAVAANRLGGYRSFDGITWIVVHTSEQSGELARSAADLCSAMTRPGTSTSGSGTYGSSYHDVIDLDRVVRPVVPANRVAFAAPGSNTQGLHVCLPGRAGQTTDQWLDDFSADQLDTLAAYIVDKARLHRLPLVGPLTPVQLGAGQLGYTDHGRVGLAFKRTDHWDVGPSFPWLHLADLITRLTAPPIPTPPPKDDDDMAAIAALYQPTAALRSRGKLKTFVLRGDGGIRHASGPDVFMAAALGAPTVPIEQDDWYDQLDANSRQGLV